MTSPEKSVAPCICGDLTCHIPYGCCHCGCGAKTPIAKASMPHRFQRRNMPMRYCKSHQFVKPRPDFTGAIPFKIDGVYCRLIPLTKGQYAIVWASDYEWLMQWVWLADYCVAVGSYYALRLAGKGEGKAKNHKIRMHQALMPTPPEGKTVDHHNGVTLDNRRDNFRFADKTQQKQNQRRYSNNSTGYRGVKSSLSKFLKFRADITVGGKRIHLGGFRTARAASAAYEAAAKKYFGDFYRPGQ
jgi:hypothetical protein